MSAERVTKTWVYFLRSGENGPIKIGFTGSAPTARLAALQTGNPEPLRLIGAIPGTMADEGKLHDRFAEAWLQGEWFRPVPELLAFIEGAVFASREQPPSYDEMVSDDLAEAIESVLDKKMDYIASYTRVCDLLWSTRDVGSTSAAFLQFKQELREWLGRNAGYGHPLQQEVSARLEAIELSRRSHEGDL